MSGLRTCILCILLALPAHAGDGVGPAVPGAAVRGTAPIGAPLSPAEPGYVFAACAGRLSALRQHQWLVDGPASEETGRRLAAMADLVEAATAPGRMAQAMALRIETRVAHAALLSRATFAGDRAAEARAAQLTAACLGLLPGQA